MYYVSDGGRRSTGYDEEQLRWVNAMRKRQVEGPQGTVSFHVSFYGIIQVIEGTSN